MRRWLLAVAACAGLGGSARAAVVILSNFTSDDLTLTVTEPERKPRTVTLAPAQVLPVTVAGPADVTFPARPKDVTLRLDPYNAYVFLPDEKAGRRLEGIELPGNPPERDARPEANPEPRNPVRVPVTLLVDDADPRTEAGWQQALRTRFDAAAAVVEAHAGVRLEFAGFDVWKSDPARRDVPALLADFEEKVRVKPGHLAIGYTSRRVNENEKEPAPLGMTRPFPASHVLLREWKPRTEAEKVEVLVQQVGRAFGATLSPDPGSVMRPTAGADGLALHRDYRVRFDPLNALAMNLWADELRRGPVARAADASPLNRARLTRVYRALLKARPGDPSALTYLNVFDRGAAVPADADPPGVIAKKDGPPDAIAKKDQPATRTARDEVARAVVRAVTTRARLNVGRDALRGDELTAAYVRAAADAALRASGVGPDVRAAGFALGLGVALDETDALRTDDATRAVVAAIETDAEWGERVAVLGNPTLRGRRDLCRRFAQGCVTGEALTQARAEEAAVNRSLAPEAVRRPAGISFAALAAEFGGVAFARRVRDDPQALTRLAARFVVAEWLPDTAGLRDGLSVERFEADYGDASDPRFQAVLTNIRTRVGKAAAAK